MTERKSRTLSLFFMASIAALSAAACGSGSAGEPAREAAAEERDAPIAGQQLAITVHKTASCTCCQGWVDHLRENGFRVTTVAESRSSLGAVKERLDVPRQLRTCHTATVNGYVIEGHVPAELIRRFVAKAPEALGLGTRPRMPVGSPGMEMPGRAAEPYDVVAFDEHGGMTVYASRPRP